MLQRQGERERGGGGGGGSRENKSLNAREFVLGKLVKRLREDLGVWFLFV